MKKIILSLKLKSKKYATEAPTVEPKKEGEEEGVVEYEALIRTAKEHLEKIIALGRMLSPDILLVLDDVSDPGRVADLIASNLRS